MTSNEINDLNNVINLNNWFKANLERVKAQFHGWSVQQYCEYHAQLKAQVKENQVKRAVKAKKVG